MAEERAVSRREFLKVAGVAGAALGAVGGLGGLLAACGGEETTTTAAETATTTMDGGGTDTTAGASTTVDTSAESGRDLKIGLVEPKTGALAAFALADDWYIGWANDALKDGIVGGDGKKHIVKILTADSQSDSNRASQVAGDLMLNDQVDLVMASGSPDTVVPVADQCETNGVIGLFNFSPWQAVFGTDVERKWSWGCMLGSEQTIADFTVAFDAIPNNKKVGMLFANDADAAAWMAPDAAPAVFEQKGFTLVVPTYYNEGSEDFTAQISMYKKEGVDIICGTNNPPSFVNFVNQALQQGLRPKIMSSGKALLFPQVPEALASGCYNFIGEMSWSPDWPFKDSLTGKTCKGMGDDFEAKMDMQWQQTIGQYSKIEWAVDLFKRAPNPEDKESVLSVIPATKLDTVNGLVDFTQPVDPNGKHNVPNNVRPVYAGAQWVKGTGEWPFDFVEISNAAAPGTEVAAEPEPMTYL